LTFFLTNTLNFSIILFFDMFNSKKRLCNVLAVFAIPIYLLQPFLLPIHLSETDCPANCFICNKPAADKSLVISSDRIIMEHNHPIHNPLNCPICKFFIFISQRMFFCTIEYPSCIANLCEIYIYIPEKTNALTPSFHTNTIRGPPITVS